MDKNYDPKSVEDKIYSLWEKGNYFAPKIDKTKKPFTVTLPPPNVTGNLHAGHAMYAIEDIMVRYHRMLGDPTLWLPGFDHASIAVEYLVTKQIVKEGKNKNEVGREEFLKRAAVFAEESKDHIRNQLIKLGFSLDWSKEAYTMDETRSVAVKEAFKRLYDKKLIYKGERIINWCPKCQTAISDLENDYEEETGKLYYIKYGPITIATTRPETMFADVAVAVNPKNKKYRDLVGTFVPLPLTDRKIPVIGDEAVELDFGTGALKITPSHDELDFEIGNRHKLEKLSVINRYGKLTEIAGKYANLKVFEAREVVVNDLQNQGFLEKIEEYKHSVGHCQRCHTVTEPIISEQWFVKTESLAKRAIKAVKDGEIKIVPKSYEKIYFNWLNNIKDWCISRQLWWGHKIPLEGEGDVLDTWFSSGLWPISVFGWPEKTTDFEYYYPTSVRETGYDIIFFWVAREIMMCLEMTGQVPYKTVYLHGLVRDEKGHKFSKTAGIGFDPLEMIDKYGADALRMALVFGTTAGKDLHINDDKVRAMRNFSNKIWNAARFVLSAPNDADLYAEQRNDSVIQCQIQRDSATNSDDEWILSELNKTIKSVTKHIETYKFGQAAEELYEFFWHSFCDKYIETTKIRREEAQPTLLHVLETSLKLLHPFMPFVTEKIWQEMRTNNLPRGKAGKENTTKPSNEDMLIIAQWPK